ncbi:hypothetical protein B0A55_13608 [Friedmanniomyces simplex]|uniref:Uncharacterized protein n=1 Tax=Friedmanniomyces simplex TaxID=329884 RepID=A0A4U0VXR0_9PEZI|nr:hypothetical protein B0A55_13608 [Friedmanniomyces simplex]
MPPRSPTALKRRQSLMLLTAPKDPEQAFEPALFNLTDLILNSVRSNSAQTVFSALKLTSTMIQRQSKYAFGTLLKVRPGDPLMQALADLLRTFLTNSVDVNLAFTQAVISIASCVALRLDAWLALEPSEYNFADSAPAAGKPWEAFPEDDETAAWFALQQASRQPAWSADTAPLLHSILQSLVHELAHVRNTVPNLDQLLAGRQHMLQASTTPAHPVSERPSLISSPTQPSFLDAPLPKTTPQGSHTRSSSNTSSSLARGRKAANTLTSPNQARQVTSPSPSFIRPSDTTTTTNHNHSPATRSIFQPPPAETPLTTDVLTQKLTFPAIKGRDTEEAQEGRERTASLNHVLTNVVILQQFVLELVAVLQVRAAVLGIREVRYG